MHEIIYITKLAQKKKTTTTQIIDLKKQIILFKNGVEQKVESILPFSWTEIYSPSYWI